MNYSQGFRFLLTTMIGDAWNRMNRFCGNFPNLATEIPRKVKARVSTTEEQLLKLFHQPQELSSREGIPFTAMVFTAAEAEAETGAAEIEPQPPLVVLLHDPPLCSCR